MSVRLTVDSTELLSTIRRLTVWEENFSPRSFDSATDQIINDYKSQIKSGRTGAGKTMPNVSNATMDMPVRYGSDRRIRRDVRGSKTPLVATGEAVESIGKSIKGNIVEILASNIFKFNRKSRTTRQGNVVPARDALVVTDRQLDILENDLLRTIDKVLK